MSDQPHPFTPPECDLTGYDWMALLGHRLFKSQFYRQAIQRDPRGGLAGIKLWWEAMLQVPAGSLPNDEDELAFLADFGTDLKAWRKHRPVAMRGWTLCSDGRWYHSVVAEQALKAWNQRLQRSQEREGWRERKQRQRNGANTEHVTRDVTRDVTEDIGRDNGEGHAGRHGDVPRARPDLTLPDSTRPEGPPKSPHGRAAGGLAGHRDEKTQRNRPKSRDGAVVLFRQRQAKLEADELAEASAAVAVMLDGGRNADGAA